MKQRFLSDPHAVLAEHGMDVPEGINVNVVENTDTTVHITMPAAPDAHQNLSNDELAQVAGGQGKSGFMNVTECFMTLNFYLASIEDWTS